MVLTMGASFMNVGLWVSLYGRSVTKLKDPYKVLGISVNDSEEVAKKAYRKLAMEYHPDRNPGNKQAEERFKEIGDAWAYLKDRIGKESREPMWVHSSLFSIYKKGA